jgi:hypothetical protein
LQQRFNEIRLSAAGNETRSPLHWRRRWISTIVYMSVLVMAAAVVVVVVDIHDDSLTDGMSVLVMMAAAVDTHDGSVDTLSGSVFVSKMSKHDVSPREGLVTTDTKHDDHLSKVKSSSYKVSVSCKPSSS